MNLTLTAKQLLSLYMILDRAKDNFDSENLDTIEEISSQLETKILDSLSMVEGANNQKMFASWQKKESEKIQGLETELNYLRNSGDVLRNKPPSNPGILRKKNKF
jgi:hypothetical protein